MGGEILNMNNIALLLLHISYLSIVCSNWSNRKCSCYVKDFECERLTKFFTFRTVLNVIVGLLLVIEDILLLRNVFGK